ncbi:MAG: hypothetical protein R3F33_17420 [Planctomycetota bacterium]
MVATIVLALVSAFAIARGNDEERQAGRAIVMLPGWAWVIAGLFLNVIAVGFWWLMHRSRIAGGGSED